MPSLDVIMAMLMGLTPFILVFYLGWRLVRALERRRGGALRVRDLTDQIRSLRNQLAILSSEVGGLDRTLLKESTGPHRGSADQESKG